ncbi:MAG: hypothetical protein KA282_03075 [Clostridia bacterium]|nr:hypothetical protein [Clostridia bacterium]
MACLAVIAFFRKNKQYNFSIWTIFIAPGIALIGLAFVLVKAVMNFDALTGAPGLVSVILFSSMVVLAVGAFAYAKYLQKNKPEVYGRIGRQDFTD